MIVLTSIQKEILKKKNNIIKIKYKEKKRLPTILYLFSFYYLIDPSDRSTRNYSCHFKDQTLAVVIH